MRRWQHLFDGILNAISEISSEEASGYSKEAPRRSDAARLAPTFIRTPIAIKDCSEMKLSGQDSVVASSDPTSGAHLIPLYKESPAHRFPYRIGRP